MTAALDHAAGLEDDDAAGRAGGAEPVSHQQDRAAGQRPAQARAGSLPPSRRRRREGVVEHQDRGCAGQRPRQGHALALTPRERQAPLTDHGLESRGEPLDLVRDPRDAGGGMEVVGSDRLTPEGDVLGDGPREEKSLLRHVADPGAKGLERNFRHVASADEHGPGRRLPEPREQKPERRFAASGGADHGDRLARRNVEAHVAQGRAAIGVGEREVRELDRGIC